MNAGRLIGVVGPSGAGKDSVMEALARARPDFHLVRRVISRAEGAGGEVYERVSPGEFERRRAELGEWAEFSRLLAERQRLLQNVSPDERRDVYEAALEANDLLIEKARADRAAAADRIQALKKQKNLDAYYESIAGVRFPDS